jgi:hypothetical protein
LDLLAEAGGILYANEEDGLVANQLAIYLGVTPSAISQSLLLLEKTGFIKKTKGLLNGKPAITSVQLVSSGNIQIPEIEGVDTPQAPPTPAERVEAVVANLPAPTPAPAGPDADAIANSLLKRVVAILSNPVNESDEKVLARLAEQVEECNRLRDKVAQLKDDVKALTEERNSLQKRLHTCEDNFKAVTSPGARAHDDRTIRELTRLMQERPNAR